MYKLLKIVVFAFILLNASSGFAQTVLTLDNSIKQALQNSPDIKSSEIALQRSKYSLEAQNAALKSKFNLSITPFSYFKDRQFNDYFSSWYTSETKKSMGTFSITQPIIWTDGTLSLNNTFGWQDAYNEVQSSKSTTFSNNLYLRFTQPLFTYNRTKLQLDELKLNLENASLSYAIQKLAIERNVTQSFYSLYEQRLTVEIANEEYESQKQNYELTKNKVAAGILSQDELYQAELNMLNSQSSLQNAQVTLQNQFDQFKQMIGMPISEDIDIILDISNNPIDVSLNKAIENGVSKRMELRQREIAIQTSQFSLIQTAATNEFYGNLNLSFGLVGTDESLTNVYDKPTNNQDVSLSFEIPLFDWGERQSRIKASETNIESNKLSLDNQRIDIIVNIRSVVRSLQNIETQIKISEISERNAKLSYDINLERYSNGDLTSIDLQKFQQQLSQAKLSRVQSLINYKLELLNLKIQSLYDFEKNEPVIPETSIINEN